jgi:hypothetical protein
LRRNPARTARRDLPASLVVSVSFGSIVSGILTACLTVSPDFPNKRLVSVAAFF